MTVVSRVAGRLLRLPRPIAREVMVERALTVVMPDGVALLTDHWVPKAPGRDGGDDRPTVLIRTPYGRKSQELFARLLAERAVPRRGTELPRHVRLGGHLGTVPSRSGRRPRHPHLDTRAIVVQRHDRDVGWQLRRTDPMGRRRRPAAATAGHGALHHRGERSRQLRVPRWCVRARVRPHVAPSARTPGARHPARALEHGARSPCSEAGVHRTSARGHRQSCSWPNGRVLPGLARARPRG